MIPFSVCLLDALEKNVSPRMYQKIVCEAVEQSKAFKAYEDILNTGEEVKEN